MLSAKSIHTRIDTTESIPVHESFYSIQGEGFHQGKAAFFIRLAGCDVGCHWCDVKESWKMSETQLLKIGNVVTSAAETPAKMVIITGGEPLSYNLNALTKLLKNKALRTHLETSGAYPLTGIWDWICLSPKKFKYPLPEIFEYANELKIVVFNKSDLKWAEENAAKVSHSCKLYLQPEWSREKEILPVIVDYIKTHPKWELSLQIHKYLGLP